MGAILLNPKLLIGAGVVLIIAMVAYSYNNLLKDNAKLELAVDQQKQYIDRLENAAVEAHDNLTELEASQRAISKSYNDTINSLLRRPFPKMGARHPKWLMDILNEGARAYIEELEEATEPNYYD